MHPAVLPVEALLKQIEFRTTRGPGPGGQHRNKSDTMVRLTHKPTGIGAQAGERRSLDLNKAEALFRLRMELAMQVRCPLPEAGVDPLGIYAPSELWRSRVGRSRRVVVSARHYDFPALLAEVLDLLAHCQDDVPRAARILGVTTTQLVKFLGLEPAALAALNHRRKERGERPLR